MSKDEIDALDVEAFAKWLWADLQDYGGMLGPEAWQAVMRRLGLPSDFDAGFIQEEDNGNEEG